MKKKTALVTAFLLMAIYGSAKYHPEVRWQEITHDKFIVVFPEGYKAEAAVTLREAQATFLRLQAFWKFQVQKKIRILLTNSYDYPQSFATFFPFNQIVISLAHPTPDSEMGNFRDWVPMVLAHEMTLIFIFNAGPSYLQFMRNIFGNLSIFYPMARFPRWLMEGLAIYGESLLQEGGRLNNADFDILLREILRDGSIPSYLTLYGIPTRWPADQARALYGSKFIQYLSQKYGSTSIPQLVKNQAEHPIILNVQRRFAAIFGKRLKALWHEFAASRKHPPAFHTEEFTILTQDGMEKKYPLAVTPDRIIYYENNFQEYPGIFLLDLKSNTRIKLIDQKDATSLFFSPKDQHVYFSAIDSYKSFYEYSDIYRFSLKTGELFRLSSGQRLTYPVKADGMLKLYCVKRVEGKDYLTLFNPGSREERILSEGFPSIAYLSVSPNGRYIAASLKLEGRSWSIALFDNTGKLIKILTPRHIKCYYPRWASQHQIYFISELNGNYRLACTNPGNGELFAYDDDRLPPVKFFELGAAGGEVLVSYIGGNGYNLGRFDILKFQPRKWVPSRENSHPRLRVPEVNEDLPLRKYNVIRDLLPKHMTVTFRNSGNEIQPGVYLSGTDLLTEHSFFFKGYHGPSSGDWSFGFNYTLDTMYPTWILDYSDYIDIYQGEDQRSANHRTTELKLGCLFPLSLARRSQAYLYTNIHFQRTEDRYFDPIETVQKKYNGFKVAYLYNSSQKYRDSISHSDGIRLAISYARDIQLLGSKYTTNTAALEYKQFFPVIRPNVLALRFTASQSWGKGEQEFFMGGTRSQSGFMGLEITEQGLFGLMRGYSGGYFAGYGGYLLNMEFRMSLMKIERCFSISPSFERIYLTVFSDIGNVWRNNAAIDPKISIGLELNIDVFLGARLPFCAGIAYANRSGLAPTFYIRIGESF